MARRRNRHKNPYPGKCRICGDDRVSPKAAMRCKKHLPTEVKCFECGAIFPWSLHCPGICPACYYPFMLEIRDGNPGYIGWQYMDWEALRRRAEEFKEQQAA